MAGKIRKVFNFLAYLHPKYLISLPERFVRASAASVGGLLYETTEVALPRWFRRSRLYQAVVYRLLRLTIEMVGDVEGIFPAEEISVKELAARKAVGNVIELASFVAVGWSPLWILAAASDISGGTRVYLHAFQEELKKSGLLNENSSIHSVDDLLNTLETSSGMAADLVDIPPINIDGLKASLLALRNNTTRLPSGEQLTNLYNEMQHVAQNEGRSVGSLSSMIAAGALRAGIQMGSTHIFDYYQQALKSINSEGWGRFIFRIVKPYYITVRGHFDPYRVTNTEIAILKFFRREHQIGRR